MQTLTKTEEEIMQYIWSIGRCTVSEILNQMGEPTPPHSTVSSVVRILEKKGFLDHKAYGKTYEYFPIIEKNDYARKTVVDIVRNYFNGSASHLVSHLVKDEKIEEAELRKLLDDLA